MSNDTEQYIIDGIASYLRIGTDQIKIISRLGTDDSTSDIDILIKNISTSGKISWWKFEESLWNGTVGEVKDSISSSNNATSTGAVVNVGWGKIGNSGYFDGSSYIIVVDDTRLQIDEGTISLWFRTPVDNTSIDNILISKANCYKIAMNTNEKITAYNYSTSTTYTSQSSKTYNDSEWHHIAFVFKSGTGFKLYIDAVLETSGDITFGNKTTHQILIGSGWDYGGWVGSIDEVAMWNRQLTELEISALYGG